MADAPLKLTGMNENSVQPNVRKNEDSVNGNEHRKDDALIVTNERKENDDGRKEENERNTNDDGLKQENDHKKNDDVQKEDNERKKNDDSPKEEKECEKNDNGRKEENEREKNDDGRKEEKDTLARLTRCFNPPKLEKKNSSGDLQSRLKTRKILGVGETNNGDVHRSKISQVLGHNDHLYTRLPWGMNFVHNCLLLCVSVEAALYLLWPSLGVTLGVISHHITAQAIVRDHRSGGGTEPGNGLHRGCSTESVQEEEFVYVTAPLRLLGAALAAMAVLIWSAINTRDQNCVRCIFVAVTGYNSVVVMQGVWGCLVQGAMCGWMELAFLCGRCLLGVVCLMYLQSAGETSATKSFLRGSSTMMDVQKFSPMVESLTSESAELVSKEIEDDAVLKIIEPVGTSKTNEGPITETSSNVAIPDAVVKSDVMDANTKLSVGSTHEIHTTTPEHCMDVDSGHTVSIVSSQVKMEKQSYTTTKDFKMQHGNVNYDQTMLDQLNEANFSEVSHQRMNVSKRMITSNMQSKTFSSVSEIKTTNSEGEVRLRKLIQLE